MCVTPEGRLWHFGRKRLLVGREKLALQGIFVDDGLASSFGQVLEGNLGGNAFNGADFFCVLLSVLSQLGKSQFIEKGPLFAEPPCHSALYDELQPEGESQLL